MTASTLSGRPTQTATSGRPQCQVVIIGAGPYGLAAAAHLRAAGIELRIFGKAMEFWDRQMPEGMNVRSVWEACHIADPRRALTLDGYVAAEGVKIPQLIPLTDFVNYGRWFQRCVAPDLDPRHITRVERTARGFCVTLDDGEQIFTQRVVVATGIGLFPRRPPQFSALPPELVSHTSQHKALGRFTGVAMAVVGGGQSALETSALLHEKGAGVQIITRQDHINWLGQKGQWLKSRRNPLRALMYPPTDVGPPGLNQIVANPGLFRRLPVRVQQWVAHRSIRPAGSGWLRPRLREVPIHMSREVATATVAGSKVKLRLDDGSERTVDHVLLATGYHVDVSRYTFLAPEMIEALDVLDGYPALTAGLESSVPGLHFLGAPAARSYGPLNRFVSGTGFAASALARYVARQAGSQKPR